MLAVLCIEKLNARKIILKAFPHSEQLEIQSDQTKYQRKVNQQAIAQVVKKA